jgi:hypothetical protein
MKARHLRRLAVLSWHDRLLLAEAVVLLGLARLAVLTLPFRWLVPAKADESASDSPPGPDETQVASIGRVRWAVGTASRRTPWNSNCLAQALAARRMLGRRGIGSTLHLGVRKGERGRLEAHAWLRCGDLPVTGGHGHEGYAVVGSFPGGELVR